MITIIIATIGIILMSVSDAQGQNIQGAPLPTVIPQDVHDFQASKAEAGECIGKGDLIYWHWIAAGHTIDLTNAEINRGREITRGSILATCGKFFDTTARLPFKGFVWKASSERSGNPVLLVNSSYFNDTVFVEAVNFTNGFFVAFQEALGTQRTELQNDNRTHFDFNKKASSLPQEIMIIIKRKNSVVECFYINNPQNDVR